MNKCSCNCDDDKSKAMYSIDYDGLIEKLEETRDELDTVIKILQDRRKKDNVINSILSEEYEDNDSQEENELTTDELVSRLLTQVYLPPYKRYYCTDKCRYPWTHF